MATDKTILQHVERDTEWQQQQIGQHAPISRDFVAKFAYETLPTPIAVGNAMMVSILYHIQSKVVI